MTRNLSPIKNDNDVINQNYAKENLVYLNPKKFGGGVKILI